MLRINKKTRDKVARLWKAHGGSITLANPSSWKKESDDEIWQKVVGQVVVVGGVAAMSRMTPELRKQIAWERLANMPESKASTQIWLVLKGIGARYVGKTESNCAKTRALIKNLKYINSIGGPRSFIRAVSLAKAPESKIHLVLDNLSYIKSKGARDFLTTGYGLLTNSIAFDIRVLGALTHLGVEGLPEKTPNPESRYVEIEREIVDGISKPVGILAAQLDQLLFLNYKAIMGRA